VAKYARASGEHESQDEKHLKFFSSEVIPFLKTYQQDKFKNHVQMSADISEQQRRELETECKKLYDHFRPTHNKEGAKRRPVHYAIVSEAAKKYNI
jgi:hypothetical protein